MPVIDGRLLEPDGKPEIAENFNRVMESLSGAGRLFPYTPQPGDFTANAIGMPEHLVPMDLSAYRDMAETKPDAIWTATNIEYDSNTGNYKITEYGNVADELGMAGMHAFMFHESVLMTFGCRITGVAGKGKLSAEAYEGFGFYVEGDLPDRALVILSLNLRVST